MKRLRFTTRYKKDVKRIIHDKKKLSALLEVLRMLEHEIQIPDSYLPHMLTGDYAGHMECHIQGDFLLIWFDPLAGDIDLVRLGSHSELFGKNKKR